MATEPVKGTPDTGEKPWHEGFGAFMAQTFKRLEAGQMVYHDLSFQRDPADLARMVEEELLDVAAWSFILWTRLRAIKVKLESEADNGIRKSAIKGA